MVPFTESREELSEPFWFNITEELIFYTVLAFSVCIKYRKSAKCFTNVYECTDLTPRAYNMKRQMENNGKKYHKKENFLCLTVVY